MRHALLLGLALGIVGCVATPPRSYTIESTSTIEASFDQVWAALIDYTGEQGWSPEVLEMDSGFMSFGNTALSAAFIDCGSSAFTESDVGPPRGSVNIVVRGDNVSTRVDVNVVSVVQARRDSFSGQPIEAECVSRGILERNVLAALAERTSQ